MAPCLLTRSRRLCRKWERETTRWVAVLRPTGAFRSSGPPTPLRPSCPVPTPASTGSREGDPVQTDPINLTCVPLTFTKHVLQKAFLFFSKCSWPRKGFPQSMQRKCSTRLFRGGVSSPYLDMVVLVQDENAPLLLGVDDLPASGTDLAFDVIASGAVEVAPKISGSPWEISPEGDVSGS